MHRSSARKHAILSQKLLNFLKSENLRWRILYFRLQRQNVKLKSQLRRTLSLAVVVADRCSQRLTAGCVIDTDAVIATLRDAGHHGDVTCSGVRDVLLAPHKHKDRNARKSKQSGLSFTAAFLILIIIINNNNNSNNSGQLSLLPSAGREMSSSYGYGVIA